MSTIQFSLPEPIKNFVFDLHEACRLSQRPEDVNVCVCNHIIRNDCLM